MPRCHPSRLKIQARRGAGARRSSPPCRRGGQGSSCCFTRGLIFAFVFSVPVGLPKTEPSVSSGAADAGTVRERCRPPGSPRPLGRVFPPVLRVFLPPPPSSCQVLFNCFIPASQRGTPGERTCGQERPPAPSRGVRRRAETPSAGADGVGVSEPAGFSACLPGKPLSWGRSPCGFVTFAAEAS